MRTLVIGGTGTVGSLVVAELLARGVEVSVLTRDVEKRTPGAKMLVGDLRDPRSVERSFDDIESVFMLIAAGTSETYEGVLAVLLAKRANVKRFAYMSSHKIDLTDSLLFGGATKLPIENALKKSGMPYTILRPNSFYQNDLWYRDSLLQNGIYPQPIGLRGMSRVDARDIAEVAAIAVTTDRHEGKTYNVVGPEVQSGPSIAQSWGQALQRTVVYGGDDLDAFERSQAFMGLSELPSYLAFPYRLYFEWYQANGLCASSEDLATMTRLMGRSPRSHASFAQETAAMWKKAAG
jgi:uncharacterized protein YbjT (DUF2867 family)